MTEEQTEGSQLRRQLEAALAENKELKGYKKANELSAAFSQYGLDPNTGAGRLAAQAYDGDLSADAAAEWLAEQGFSKPEPSGEQQSAPSEPPPGLNNRVEQQGRLDSIRDSATPAAQQRLSRDDAVKLSKSDPHALVQAQAEGRVDWEAAS